MTWCERLAHLESAVDKDTLLIALDAVSLEETASSKG
jgi:hypothetical protein